MAQSLRSTKDLKHIVAHARMSNFVLENNENANQ